MRRFRVVFVAVCVVLLAGLGLLVRRTLGSVALEREMRHRAVADRVFDEMERALSGLLAPEEERPFGHYGFTYVPPGQLGGAVTVTRSPLADLPALDFVVGYFQVDPDGSLHTPFRPRPGEASEWRPTADALERIARIERTVGGQWHAGGPGAGRDLVARPLPGTTMALAAAAPAREEEAPAVESAYDAFQALNKGVEQRSDRQAKRSLEYPVRLGDRRANERDAAASVPDERAERASEDAPFARRPAPTPLELPPMLGRVLDARHMILYRTVVLDTLGYRQGLLLDVERLEAWLRAQALGGDGLAQHATLAFSAPFVQGDATAPDGFAYLHRFAEPFDDLGVRLTLQALPGTGSATLVSLLAGLLLAAAGLGLAALYRMVSVVVGFAERRSNFVAAVSHELKTPLTAIRMYGEMLRDGMVASEAKRDEYYRHITVESERLSRLINNVLEFSRLEKGTRELALVTAAVGPAVHEVVALLGPHAAQEGFELRAEIDPDLPPVRFERDALMQVIFNLVDNAVKYARARTPQRITIHGRYQDGGVHLVVRDYGPGVPPRHLGRIFEPFYRGERELTRRSKGTGLGLALVRGLAEGMGARVAGRNVAEGGFEVEIVFPVAA
jgi:signal transduction histidine kinase